MTIVAILVKFAVGAFFVNVPHIKRAAVFSVLVVVSFVLIAISSYYDNDPRYFDLVVIASFVQGIASGIGETTFLGFLKEFPSHLVGSVSSGTGFAGIFGTTTLIAFNAMKLSNVTIFLMSTPTMLVYYGSYLWLNK